MSDDVQAISPEEAANGMAGRTGLSNPFIEYILNRPPYTRYRWNGSGLVSVSQSSVAAALRAAYETEQLTIKLLGNQRALSRGNIPAADIPFLSQQGNPTSSEATATQIVYPYGGSNPDLSLEATRRLGKRWFKGYSPSLYSDTAAFGYAIRIPASLDQFNTNASLDKYPPLNWGATGALCTTDLQFEGNTLYIAQNVNARFRIWINDRLVTNADITTDTPTNITFDATDNSYRCTSGGGGTTMKLRWATSARRELRIAWRGNDGTPLFFQLKQANTLLPLYANPLRWVHIGDSFSIGTGATYDGAGCDTFLRDQFGRSIDMLNLAAGGTSVVNGQLTPSQFLTAGVPSNVSPTTGVRMNQSYIFNTAGKLAFDGRGVDVVTLLVGHNDTPVGAGLHLPRAVELLQAIRTAYPGALIFVLSANCSPPNNTGTPTVAVVAERVWMAAAGLMPGCIGIQLQEGPAGQFFRGTGNTSSPNGTGNADVWTGSDNVHPSDAGHRALGEFCAARIYDACVAMT